MPTFANSRTTTVAAPTDAIHPLVNDFHAWTRWSPWEDIDPALQRTYSGPDQGVGAHYAWAGNNKVGEGSMTITGSTPDRIDIDLEFIKPFKASNKAVFVFTPAGGGTEVNWTMTGHRNPVLALMGKLFFDARIGKDFDKGLARLKAAAESAG